MISLLLARAYLQTRSKHHAVHFMMRISFCSIAIGTFSLMLTLIIMNGFEKTIHEKMQGITAHAIVHAPGQKIDDVSIQKFLSRAFAQEIEATSAACTRQVLFEKNDNQSILFLRGVTPHDEASVSSLPTKIITPHPIHSPAQFSDLMKEHGILIGKKMATTHSLSVGDTVHLLIPEPTSKKKILLKKEKVKVLGVFSIGLDEYDNNFAYTTLSYLRSLFDEERGVDLISLVFAEESEIKMSLQKRIGNLLYKFWPLGKEEHEHMISRLRTSMPDLRVDSWKDLYPALASSLKLEKYVMFFILALIVMVASMCMVSVLFMQIQQKRHDIAILKAMGASHALIQKVFLLIGMGITLFGTLAGLVCAGIAGTILERYPFIQLPDVYYVSHLPARLDGELFVVVFACALLLGFIATLVALRKSKYLPITQVLRQE